MVFSQVKTRICHKTGLSKEQVDKVLYALIDEIEGLLPGDWLNITWFGKFSKVIVKEKTLYNPRIKGFRTIPPTVRLKFQASRKR